MEIAFIRSRLIAMIKCLAGSCYAFHVDVSKSVDISIHVHHWLEKLERLTRDSSPENAKGPRSNVKQKRNSQQNLFHTEPEEMPLCVR